MPTKTKPKKDWKKIAAALAARVAWALKFMDVKGGGFVFKSDTNGVGEVQDWEDYFCDALDMYGFKVDRKKLRAMRAGKKRRRA